MTGAPPLTMESFFPPSQAWFDSQTAYNSTETEVIYHTALENLSFLFSKLSLCSVQVDTGFRVTVNLK